MVIACFRIKVTLSLLNELGSIPYFSIRNISGKCFCKSVCKREIICFLTGRICLDNPQVLNVYFEERFFKIIALVY